MSTPPNKLPFVRAMFVDTTGTNWTSHAEDTFQAQTLETIRVGLTEFEDSGIDWDVFATSGEVRMHAKKQLRQHQRDALQCVKDGLVEANRGKLIMACGTGKTFTGLKIAEELAGKGGRVLFLVPSLALMQQTVREWSIDSQIPLRSFAVCSDAQVGVRRSREDTTDIDVHDLEIPATTSGSRLAARATSTDPERMTVIFSTYQSIQAISVAQKQFGLPDFDLIICDEAHRTTGVTLAGEDESNFVRIHDQGFIAARKRLYMTATPRVYGEAVQRVAEDEGATLCSMDDEALYGKVLFTRNFGWAVQNGLLTDYKVIVLAVNEADVAAGIQARLADADSELVLDDATKIVGCYKALLKSDFAADAAGDSMPMRRAITFCKSIAASKTVEAEFARVADDWRDALAKTRPDGADELPELACQVRHVDGTFNAKARDTLLSWVKEDTGRADECRILTNARCLSEGVDVPALDAIMFLHPRKSQIDVVQAVGRVMRRAEGKRLGYVILPIGVPAGVEPEEALNNNEKYKVVWQILNALRSHDERLDATINKIGLGVDAGERIEIIAVSNSLPQRSDGKKKSINIGQGGGAGDDEPGDGSSRPAAPQQADFQFDEFSRAIMARIVRKCGTRTYWEDWASDVARIAAVHITRIRAAIEVPDSEEAAAFDRFLAEIRDDLNDAVTADEAIEMLAQHLITRPVFEALFEGYSFASNNPISRALEEVLSVLDRQHLEKETQALEGFYASVRTRATGVDNAEAKQKIIVELYDKFFRSAFPRMTERLGIVYTPVEVVDFILHSVDELLQSEFGQTVGSEGVHIIDPFVGTGTFITRLLQSGLIKPEQLAHKYAHELHANEIVLLAYYIAAINIEAVYHSMSGGEYKPFDGICLTDTFQLYEQERDLISDLMVDNSHRRTRQKQLDIRVIVGNPPYSVGQGSANEDAANVAYPKLDDRIRDTYAARTRMTNKRSLYNSYIRAIRWASDRIGTHGVIGFVTNGGWVDGNAADGIRLCLANEFSSIHVFHLRGDARTSGEQRRKEKDNVFGQGTRTPVAITLLVKNPNAVVQECIRFYDIGDYLTREEKLASVAKFGSIGGLQAGGRWTAIQPDKDGNWVSQGEDDFDSHFPMASKKDQEPSLFLIYSAGMKTNRDNWCYNSSRLELAAGIERSIAHFNSLPSAYSPTSDDTQFKWCQKTLSDLSLGKKYVFDSRKVRLANYRPFSRLWLYMDSRLNWSKYLTDRYFPKPDTKNRAICVSAPGFRGSFTAIMTDIIPSIHFGDIAGVQCFPQTVYDAAGESGPGLDFGPQLASHGISDAGLAHFEAFYPGETITKDDLFHYVYGLLHSPDYRARYGDNLSKQLPRIPALKSAAAFWAFVEAGRRLGDLHCDFDSVEPFPVDIAEGSLKLANIPDPARFYHVEKMRFGGRRPNLDRTTVLYNPNITMTGIPLEAYDYVVNGKPALEWVMERQCIKTDTASGIVSDANRYAIETVGDPAYPLLLFQRVITVSLETMAIVASLPRLDIIEPSSTP
ncbi:MAG: DEAD/DEAH box helicase [Sphingomonas sp.]